MNSFITSKREKFRNQIRQKQLESYFATKRKLLQSYQMIPEKHSFRIVLESIGEGRDVEQNLSILNGLAFERQLSEQYPSEKEAEQAYFDIVHFLAARVSSRSSTSQEDSSDRIKSVNSILNLLSDPHCPNAALAEPLCAMLNEVYGNVSSWGFDQEMLEVGFMIGNLINKESFGREAEENALSYLCEWIEDLLHIKEQRDMSEGLYFGLLRLVGALQARYGLGTGELPQLFKARVLSFVQITLFNDELNECSISGLTLRAANFLQHLLPVILTAAPAPWLQRLADNIFQQLGTLKKALTRVLCRMLTRMLTLSEMSLEGEQQERAIQARSQLRNYVVEKYINKLIIYLTFTETEMKERIFEVVLRLVDCDRQDALYFLGLFLDLGLVNWMLRTFDPRNQDMNFLFFQMVSLATDLNLRDSFAKFVELAEKSDQSRIQANP